MAFPFLRTIATKFRRTGQLARMSAKDIHELQYHIRQTHREWEEVKKTLKRISELTRDVPEGQHRKAIEQVFKHVDAFTDIERRYDKKLEKLKEHVDAIEQSLEIEKKAA